MNDIPVRYNVPFRELTTLRLGGFAKRVFSIETREALREAILFLRKEHEPYVILGSGSNTCAPDEDFNGTILHIAIPGITHEEEKDSVSIRVGAGVWWDDVVRMSAEKEWWGIENLSYIPGTVGAAPVQNIGAYGVEVCSVIETVETYNPDTDLFETFDASSCVFAYRTSAFKEGELRNRIIAAVSFRLSKIPAPKLTYPDVRRALSSDTPSLKEIRDAVIAIRSSKFPQGEEEGTAGSFFQNPIVTREHAEELFSRFPGLPTFPQTNGMVKVSLAWILDNVLSLKGFRVGGARLYEKQPLVVVTETSATAHDVAELVAEVSARVFEKTSITVVQEVRALDVRT